MAGENTLATETTEASAPVESGATTTTAPVSAPKAEVGASVGGGKNVVLPSSSLGKIKQEQRERGKREAMTELESKFKAHGFSSLDEAFEAMAALRNGGAPSTSSKAPAKAEAQTSAQAAQSGIDRKQYERLQREREQFARRYAQEQEQRRKLQRTLEAKEAEMALRETAVVKGVRDVDYALRLLQRELEGKDEAALSTFDEGKFFDALRGSHPYLFGETTVPANTGTGIGAAPSAPKAGAVTQAQGAAGLGDARKMSQDEFQKMLRARGLSTTSL